MHVRGSRDWPSEPLLASDGSTASPLGRTLDQDPESGAIAGLDASRSRSKAFWTPAILDDGIGSHQTKRGSVVTLSDSQELPLAGRLAESRSNRTGALPRAYGVGSV